MTRLELDALKTVRVVERAEPCHGIRQPGGMTNGSEIVDTQIADALREALMCSVFISPSDPGLTYEELQEIGRRAGYRDGEVNDALRQVANNYTGRDRYIPEENIFIHGLTWMPDNPELRDFDAFDFVVKALNERIREVGIREAQVDRGVVVEQAVGSGLNRTAVEAAITYMVFGNLLAESNGSLRTTQVMGTMVVPGDRWREWKRGRDVSWPRPHRARMRPIVSDVIGRRTDGRPSHVEPLAAFPDALDRLGFRTFKVWWTQTAREMLTSDPSSAATARIILAAALVEGALTFVVQHARSRGLAVFQSSDFQRTPEHWKIVDLIRSAATGGKDAVLTQDAKVRAETLAKARQRIHAGRMMVEHPGGPPDIKPEEARDAQATAEMVTRQVLEWLGRNPPS